MRMTFLLSGGVGLIMTTWVAAAENGGKLRNICATPESTITGEVSVDETCKIAKVVGSGKMGSWVILNVEIFRSSKGSCKPAFRWTKFSYEHVGRKLRGFTVETGSDTISLSVGTCKRTK